jgi:predicted RNA binding protein YcfA (HicA-like mRNA interferase family)
MSPKMPVVSAQNLIEALERIGYEKTRQRGSHIRLLHASLPPISVPNHKEIRVGLLAKILRDANLDVEQLIQLIRE